ncbi:hypothetical protein [Sphingobacterium bovistauri]|uniref:Polysaccharide chain length determinant N-terminal domain-containing protein n=1 Tax=Sphingobacterium bovistauri TaxID=2781959 RepID=A0ABS7Z1J0_9SPHI|nr:hypothetical protein [Sphingobacterium bovistauri]MCA5004039.1 hypothetical protein [Sphingobacterium bovistauri]
MFKKPTSDKVDKPTIWLEIYNRWEDQINFIKIKIITILRIYPRIIFAFMVTSILISIVCFFYLYKSPKDNHELSSAPLLGSVTSSIGSIASSAGALKELLALQSIIENIVSKDSLTHQDSIMVLHVFERMQKIENSMKKPKISDTVLNQ